MSNLPIGVCTWSLQAPTFADALGTVRDRLGLEWAQLGLFDGTYAGRDEVFKAVGDSGVKLTGTCLAFAGEDYGGIAKIAQTGGYKPDGFWEDRLAKTIERAEISAALGVKLVTVHVGFVPHDSRDPQHAVMVDRVKRVCDELAQRGLTLVMETGQEKAEHLLSFIQAVGRPNVAVNFDPANMILYGAGEPAEAVAMLKEHIRHVHMKDAIWSSNPGTDWGEEVVLGTGAADIPRIVSKLRSQGYAGPFVIEREAGPNRVSDILQAKQLLESLLA